MYPEKGIARRIKKHVKAKKQLFFAICQPGFEDILRDELIEEGVECEKDFLEGGVEFFSKIEACYRLHLVNHLATRFLMRLSKFKVLYFEKLAAHIAKFPWELYIRPEIPLAFNVKCRHSRLYHTGRIEIEFRKGIENYLKEKINYQPDKTISAQQIFIRFKNDICSVSLDCSGEPLYKRNYKKNIINAPLRETLAALILAAANFSEYDILIDPMCGSGTFSIEALLLNCRILPGIKRRFAFENWPVFSKAAFSYMKKTLQKEKVSSTIKIYASDKNNDAVQVTKANIEKSGFADSINLSRRDFFKLNSQDFLKRKILLVLNPPYGKRIGDQNEIKNLYKRIGQKIKNSFKNSGYAVIAPGHEAEKALGLKYDKKILFRNGGIKVALLVKFCHISDVTD